MSGCGTLAHQHCVGIIDNGRADLSPAYGGVELDLQALRDIEDDRSLAAAIWKPIFLLDCPVSAIGDTLFLPQWLILKAIHQEDPLPPWHERRQREREEEEEEESQSPQPFETPSE